ncbi:MAG TPA: S9 family peptidase [Ktedonobacterales bacterium]
MSDQPAPASLFTRRVPVTPEMVTDLRYASGPAISPDGTRVAFTLAEWVPGSQRRRRSIWITDEKGGARPFATDEHGKTNEHSPAWSPDGQWLAFISERDAAGGGGKPQAYVVPASGGSARALGAMPNGVSDIAWSPDGARIAFTSLDGPEPEADPIIVTPGRHTRLWTVSLTGGQPEPVTPAGLTVWEFVWSPDSRRFALFFGDQPNETDWYRGLVGVVDADGGAVRSLVRPQGQAGALAWSPDSARIGYVSGEWSDRGLVGGDVFVIPAEGGEARNLTPGLRFSPSWLQWLPDGERMLYCAFDGLSGQVGVLIEASGEMTTLEADVIVGDGAWPRLSATHDGRMFATVISDPRHHYEIYRGALTGPEAAPGDIEWTRLTRLNPLADETYARAPSRGLSYTGADGWEMQALYTPPLRHSGAGAPPMILMVHGGPTSAHRDDFTGWQTQVLASAGFAVLRPNPRGSIGRGVKFGNAVLGDMGGKDLDDLLAGVDYAIAQGLADPNRLAIMGWSYGGFITAWAVTQTQRFKAAMMGAGICDYHSFHAQTNIQDWDLRFIGADPNQDPEAYRAKSAITFVKQVTTPTLIIHGEKDVCVPVNQAWAFYNALRERGVPVECAIYPRENHGFSERDHLVDYQERIIRWMKKYV